MHPDPEPPGANGANGPPKRRHPLRRATGLGGGVVFLVVGLITWPMPIPVGLIFITLGLVLLAQESHVARSAIRWTRGRLPALDRGMRRAAVRLPAPVRAVIHMTTPDHDHRLGHDGKRDRGVEAGDSEPARSRDEGGTAAEAATESASSSQG